MSTEVATIRLKPKHETGLRRGSLWVMAHDIARIQGELTNGGLALVRDSKGRYLGTASTNPTSWIVGRILTHEQRPVDRSLLLDRIRAAVERRRVSLEDPSLCRLVFAEADGLPGVIVDRYLDVLVVQTMTQWADNHKPLLVDVLREVLSPTSIVERNDIPARRMEGLEFSSGVLWGATPEPVEVSIGPARFHVDVLSGQKTGTFLDQRENQLRVAHFLKGRRVLDAFCFAGGFGLQAAAAGATSVLGVDMSADAVSRAQANASLNRLDDRCSFLEANVFDFLRTRSPGEFEGIILDPPAFARNRRALEGAVRGYKEINLRAMKLLPPGGILVTCSCSHHMERDLFLQLLVEAGLDAKRSVRVLEERGHPADHPVLLGHPETQYLKCFILQVD